MAQCSVFQADLAIELNTSKENVLLEDSYVGQTVSEGHVRINVRDRKYFKGNSNGDFWNTKNLQFPGTLITLI